MRCLGSSTGEAPKVPTLKQVINARLNIPDLNVVTLIFLPNKYPVISFQCEEKFRVNVREGDQLFEELVELLPTLPASKGTLFVEVPANSVGNFILHLSDEESTEWELFTWGLRGQVTRKRTKRAGKEPRATLKNS